MTDQAVRPSAPPISDALIPAGRASFAERIANMAVNLQQVDRQAQLVEIVKGAVGLVPGCEHVALVIYDKDGNLVAPAVSGPETTPLIALQNELREGPCRETAATNRTLRSPDTITDSRWPRFAVGAGELGIGSMLCTPLLVGVRAYGSLSMASGTRNAFDAESEMLAEIFAAHAAVSLAAATSAETLQLALATRDLIGQAKGILMERYGLDDSQAFAVLVRESKDNNLKLRLVSEHLCRTGQLPSSAV